MSKSRRPGCEHVDASGWSVAMLGDSTSIFPKILAAEWRQRGIDVTLVSRQSRHVARSTDELSARSTENASILYRFLQMASRLFGNRLEKLYTGSFVRQFRSDIGREPLGYERAFLQNVIDGLSIAHRVASLRPTFVFANQAAAYGPAAAFCHGIPKVVFPWGGDVFWEARTSPLKHQLIGWCLRRANFVCPSATTAAAYIAKHFRVRSDRVRAVSWGVDLEEHRPASPAERARICRRYRIPVDSVIVLNARRFRRDWGAEFVFGAFSVVARRFPASHFILIGGKNSEEEIEEAKHDVTTHGLAERFTILEGQRPHSEFCELVSIADVFTSFLGTGDMRSLSVLEASAGGGVPVLLDSPEYREMGQSGFRAFLVQRSDHETLVDTIQTLANDPAQRSSIRQANREYLAEHEDRKRQMDLFLSLIQEKCTRQSGQIKGRRQAARSETPVLDEAFW